MQVIILGVKNVVNHHTEKGLTFSTQVTLCETADGNEMICNISGFSELLDGEESMSTVKFERFRPAAPGDVIEATISKYDGKAVAYKEYRTSFGGIAITVDTAKLNAFREASGKAKAQADKATEIKTTLSKRR